MTGAHAFNVALFLSMMWAVRFLIRDHRADAARRARRHRVTLVRKPACTRPPGRAVSEYRMSATWILDQRARAHEEDRDANR